MNGLRRRFFIVVCTVPALLMFAVFVGYPFCRSIVMAFYSWSGIASDARFVGLDNFRTMLNDRIVWTALRNNLFLLLVVPLMTMTLSLGFAVLLTRKKLKERAFYRVVFFFPNVLAIVVISILWSFVYHPTFGFLNTLLSHIGLEQWTHAWLGDARTVLWSVAMPMVWQSVGYYMIIYIAAIEGIPEHLYEAARIDGASEWRQLAHVTFPLIWEMIRITIVFFLIGVFNNGFTYINIMTNGGPDNASDVLITYMYRQGMNYGNFGYAMAIGVLMLVLTLGLAWISNRLTKREIVEY